YQRSRFISKRECQPAIGVDHVHASRWRVKSQCPWTVLKNVRKPLYDGIDTAQSKSCCQTLDIDIRSASRPNAGQPYFHGIGLDDEGRVKKSYGEGRLYGSSEKEHMFGSPREIKCEATHHQ